MNIEELRGKADACKSTGTIATMDWALWSEKIRSKMIFDDPSQFLRWPCIQETMFVTHARGYIEKELDYILSLPQSRWRRALREHPIGGPVIANNNLYTSGNLIHMVYHIAMFELLSGVEVSSLDTVLEVGGGYGCMRRAMRNLGFAGRYAIFDLPVLLALQEFYIDSTLSGETEFLDDVAGFEPSGRSLCIGMWSLSEMPLTVRAKLEQILPAFDFTFFAYQKEYSGIDNTTYFDGLADRIGHSKSVFHEIHQGNFYLLTEAANGEQVVRYRVGENGKGITGGS